MQKLVSDQRSYFNEYNTRTIDFRKAQLKKLKSVLKKNESALNTAIYSDFKKSEFDTFVTELALLYTDIDEAIKKLHAWSKKKRVRTNLFNFPGKSYIIPEPLGVCLVIGAWNYPYQLSFAPVIAAIAAGNTVVLKPSEIPSATSKIMIRLISENFDPNYFVAVEGGVEETTELLKQKFDKIFFTGSTKVGQIVYEAAAKNLTPVTLELGGKSPAFITENCNLEIAVKRLIWGKFLNSGQTCIAPDYVMVHKSIETKFLELAKEEIIKEKFAFENHNYVQIINEANLDRLQKLLIPEKIYFGAEINRESRYFQPTLMRDVSFDDAVMQEEIFGPILPVISYENINEAIQLVNKLPKPLSCYVFTRSSEVKEKILSKISFGGGAINETVMHIANPNLPFGGVGNSGMGNYHGEAGFRTFSHYKSVLEKYTWFEPSLKYYPHSDNKLKWIKRIFNF